MATATKTAAKTAAKVDAPVTFDASKGFSNKNPSGVWCYGSGIVGGDFNQYPKFQTGNVEWWKKDGWQSVYKNVSGAPQVLSGGLTVQPGDLVMHPGNGHEHLTKIRFTAPEIGNYKIGVKFTPIDKQAKRTWAWVYTNAASQTGRVYNGTPQGFKEIFTQGMTGYNNTISFTKDVYMLKGEILSFEVGNGGDGYFDDSVKIELAVEQQALAGWFRLKTMFRGEDECLEGCQAAAGPAFMDRVQNVSGQFWRFEPDAKNPGYYRLKTMFRGNGECLEGNQASSPVHNGAAFMAICQDVSGQLWKVVPQSNGYFRLQNMFRGEGESLEGNQPASPVHGGRAFMDSTQNVSGQYWKFEKQ